MNTRFPSELVARAVGHDADAATGEL